MAMDNPTAAESSPLQLTTLTANQDEPPPNPIPKAIALRLYASHFLSTWNSRLFEFAAVLFLASIYPSTLMPMSIYAICRSAAAILLSQPVGSWVDSGNRLVVVRASILGQRIATVLSCGGFWAMEKGVGARDGVFAGLVLLACVEKLCAVMNTVAVERDWAVVITEESSSSRRVLNARLRRIDLLCKLLGPLAISNIAIASTLIAIWATMGMNLVSVLVEYVCIKQVYQAVPALRRPRTSTAEDLAAPTGNNTSTKSSLRSFANRIIPISSLPFYFRHSAFLPSFSLSLLYLTVLSFSGQMITYLLSVGYTTLYVGIARTVSTILELSATWIAPRLIEHIGPVRCGIWSLSWQMIWLTAGLSWFLAGHHSLRSSRVVHATGLAVGVALSRVGLWGYDLSAQIIVQDEVEAGHRGSFSAVEAAFQNLGELLSFATTIIFSRPDQFQWPAIISAGAVYLAGGLYTYSVRRRRGHLLHPPSCIKSKSDRG